jgi:transaldolase
MCTVNDSYLRWLVERTPTRWWHDSADPVELAAGLQQGASGVTTNPVLTNTALCAHPERWNAILEGFSAGLSEAQRAEELTRRVVTRTAEALLPYYGGADARQGYVCGQVNPRRAGDRDVMLAMARRYHAWAPNIAVKLPVTAAGLDVLEECAAEGISVTATISFCVPQVAAVAERYRRAQARAQRAGMEPGRCYAVIMIGRLDDYLTDIAHDQRAEVSEDDIRLAGLAVTKRAYALYRERGYDAVLLVAALRGVHHMVGLAGAQVIMSIHPKVQAQLLAPGVPREERIDEPVPDEVLNRLLTIPDFRRAYEPDGLAPEQFMSWGLTQRTLSQFVEAGWSGLESYAL